MSFPSVQLTRRTTLIGVAGLALAGCASKDGRPTGRGGSGDAEKLSADNSSDAVISISSAHGIDAMWPNEPLDIAVDNGTLSSVKITDSTGALVPGKLSGTQWTADRGALLVRSTYTVEAVAEDQKGRTSTKNATLTTANPEMVVEVDFRYADGRAVGNGMPIWVRFDMSVNPDQRAAIEKRAKVTTVPAQEGAWGWANETTLYWRPREYWKPGSTAHVEVTAAGLPAGDTWVLNDASADYVYGDLRLMVTDIDNHQLTCYQNGELVRTIPVSCGKPGMETMTGTKVIMDKQSPVLMDSDTFGVPASAAGGYKLDVLWAQRLTWSGEYFHAAPWADASHGSANVSHGCTGMTNANAEWLYGFTMVGDPAEFTGSTYKVQPHQTIGCWTYSWDEWKAQSAV